MPIFTLSRLFSNNINNKNNINDNNNNNTSRLFPEVEVANTFIHVKSQDPDEFVARRSGSSPPKMFKVISFSKQPQQESEAVRPEANQGGVASAEHVGFESPGRSSTQQQQQRQQHQQQQQQNQQQKMQTHQRGQCRPCSFQSVKADNCRLGDDCQFCDLCTYEDFMQKKNAGKHERRKRLRGVRAEQRYCVGRATSQAVRAEQRYCVGRATSQAVTILCPLPSPHSPEVRAEQRYCVGRATSQAAVVQDLAVADTGRPPNLAEGAEASLTANTLRMQSVTYTQSQPRMCVPPVVPLESELTPQLAGDSVDLASFLNPKAFWFKFRGEDALRRATNASGSWDFTWMKVFATFEAYTFIHVESEVLGAAVARVPDPTAAASAATASTYEDFVQKKNAGKHDRRKRLRGEWCYFCCSLCLFLFLLLLLVDLLLFISARRLRGEKRPGLRPNTPFDTNQSNWYTTVCLMYSTVCIKPFVCLMLYPFV
ncbi:unnamed protein product [Polarella glacialis]|uniref:Uncharacterized protein n=1 Tax=Polarella glacialis TaxID=89957 RepID=A0A813HQP3_POLGL|nr:unnamed protein product [Polarella glacialis]